MTHILDPGPLIAALNRNDSYHRWARETIARLGPPFHSCPEALAEAAAMTGQPLAIVEMVQASSGAYCLVFSPAPSQVAAEATVVSIHAER